MYEINSDIDTLIASDTILYFGSNHTTVPANHMRLKANGDYSSCEWSIDDRPLISGKQSRVEITTLEILGASHNGSRHTVRLIARDTNWAKCVSGDDGIDTVYRTLTVISAYKSHILGKYRGVASHSPTDSFTVELRMIPYLFTYSKHLIPMLFNFPNGGKPVEFAPSYSANGVDTIVARSMTIDLTSRSMDIWSGRPNPSRRPDKLNQVQGLGFFSPDGNTLTIRYSEIDPKIRNRVYGRQFIGQRIN
jgi:hypothetical protein